MIFSTIHSSVVGTHIIALPEKITNLDKWIQTKDHVFKEASTNNLWELFTKFIIDIIYQLVENGDLCSHNQNIQNQIDQIIEQLDLSTKETCRCQILIQIYEEYFYQNLQIKK
jgi:hypothetical protein